MSNLKTAIILFLIISTGIFVRFSDYHKFHPDQDEHYEYFFLRKMTPAKIFKRDTMYGDHTSFPGEAILHYIPMRLMKVYVGAERDESVYPYKDWKKSDYLRLVIPKIILYFIGIIIFIKLALAYTKTRVGFIIAMAIYMFNSQLIFHAFVLRPYAVLPLLAIFNLFLCESYFKNQSPLKSISLGLLIFITCIYHAYGILIAGLPLIYCMLKYKKWNYSIMIYFLISAAAWAYYASYSTFGMTPNAIQKVDTPFRYMPAKVMPFLANLFGDQILMMIILPFVSFKLFKKHSLNYYLFLSIMILFPIIAIIAVDLKTSYWILPRQWIWVMPYFALFCGFTVDGSEELE